MDAPDSTDSRAETVDALPVQGSGAGGDLDLSAVDRIVDETGRDHAALIPVLRALQDHYHYLPPAALRRVCELTEASASDVAGVSTFYAQFRHRPAGRHTIKVCIGTACHVKGAEAAYEAFRRHLAISGDDDTDRDRLFTVDKVACLGCCMLAPAVQIDDVTYGFVDAEKVPGILRDFLQSRGAEEDGEVRQTSRAASGDVRMCLCSSCVAAGTAQVFKEFERQAQDLSLAVHVRSVGCTGISYQAPLVDIAMSGGEAFRYARVDPENVRALLLRHFRPAGLGRRVRAAVSGLLERLFTDEAWEPVTRYAVDVRTGPDSVYVGGQRNLVTQHCGQLDPLDLEDYISHGGFEALNRCRSALSRDEIIDLIRSSGLRGRGGSGYATWQKWATVRTRGDATTYVICNGDEGDPGAFMDRMILESFPFRVIEGMLIAAIAVGASEGLLYIRAEYPLATDRLREAVRICRERGVLNLGVDGAPADFPLSVVEGAGAFVCGEETALIAAIEGGRGMPRFRPPYPAECGLWGHPTLVNNVETFAMVPYIVRAGVKAFRDLGTEGSPGTKAFALAGKVVRGGLIEVPMGMTLRRIVEEIGGGIQDGRQLKAIQVGGPSGGCVPESLADTPVDFDALTAAGAMMGSGGMVVLDETDCMVDISRYFMTFTQRESCGKCTYGRIGTKKMLEILDRLCEGQGRDGDLEELEHLAFVTRTGSLCGLGRTAPNPVLSTLRYFRHEYEAHLQGRCPARKCRALITYRVTDSCIGCTRCAQRCPVDAIPVTPYRRHCIDESTCIRCDTCRKACPVDAIEVV